MAGLLDRKAAKAEHAAATEAQVGRPAPPRMEAGRRSGDAPPDGTVRPSCAPRSSPAPGCAFRPALIPVLFDELSTIEVWEHIADWYLHDDGPRRLGRFARVTPITLHCLTLSVGSEVSADAIERAEAVGALVRAAGVDHVSDHLAFSRVGATTLPHFVPLWRTEEQLELVAQNVDRIQTQLGVQLLLENPASPLDPGGDMSTAEFLNQLCSRTGCQVLLDLENVRVNAVNGLVDAEAELNELDLRNVGGIHLAGGTDPEPDGPAFDAHAWPVRDIVMDWLTRVVPQAPRCRWVVLERDGRFEEGAEVLADLGRVRHALGRCADTAPQRANR
jgi:uncharacterized protein